MSIATVSGRATTTPTVGVGLGGCFLSPPQAASASSVESARIRVERGEAGPIMSGAHHMRVLHANVRGEMRPARTKERGGRRMAGRPRSDASDRDQKPKLIVPEMVRGEPMYANGIEVFDVLELKPPT